MVTGCAESPQLLAIMEPVTVAADLSLFPSVTNKQLLYVRLSLQMSVSICVCFHGVHRVTKFNPCQQLMVIH